jgi:hypothetical protein
VIPLAVLTAGAVLALRDRGRLDRARLSGWEDGLLVIPFVLAAMTVALEGYRLFREPHVGRERRARPT